MEPRLPPEGSGQRARTSALPGAGHSPERCLGPLPWPAVWGLNETLRGRPRPSFWSAVTVRGVLDNSTHDDLLAALWNQLAIPVMAGDGEPGHSRVHRCRFGQDGLQKHPFLTTGEAGAS